MVAYPGFEDYESVALGEHFVAVGSASPGISFSDDGVTWTPAESVEEPD